MEQAAQANVLVTLATLVASVLESVIVSMDLVMKEPLGMELALVMTGSMVLIALKSATVTRRRLVPTV